MSDSQAFRAFAEVLDFFIPFLHCLVFLQQPCDFVIRLRFLLMLMIINSILGDSGIPTYRLCNLCEVYWTKQQKFNITVDLFLQEGSGIEAIFEISLYSV